MCLEFEDEVVDCFWYLHMVGSLKAVCASVGVGFTYSLEIEVEWDMPRSYLHDGTGLFS